MSTASRSVEVRRYRILELVGRGGFGKVYRARLEGADGFSKDVAIKLLTDRVPPSDVLQRFRDESRILGLVRDRALLAVDPPTRLDDRWAIVMEYVPGASCSALLQNRGPLPARVALEIIQEIARALDHVFHEEGPDGRPLELVHRDLKPGNVQITRAGEVKILDFGVARAQFDAREAITTRSIRGTYGYIAPERLQGIETPAGDVYSLGMVLFRLVTAGPTDRKLFSEAIAATRGAEHHTLSLAARMCQDEISARPSLREVEDTCRELIQRIKGPGLRQWAEANVPHSVGTSEDDLCGKVLTATLQLDAKPPASRRSRSGTMLLVSLTGFNAALILLGLSVASVFLFGPVRPGDAGSMLSGLSLPELSLPELSLPGPSPEIGLEPTLSELPPASGSRPSAPDPGPAQPLPSRQPKIEPAPSASAQAPDTIA
ncbi:MAG TPA: serine/threonine protein kinase, partial [Deltaproteobacteria bacterium]|nr:serine/threonine protein kinase [Deltaproteobacteria bacterium]